MGEPFGPDIDWSALKDIVDRSNRDLGGWRDQIARMVRQYAGGEVAELYADMAHPDAGGNSRTMNALGVLVETYMQNLVAGSPRARVTSSDSALKFQARLFGLALNRVLEAIRVRDTLEQGVLDAIFGIGIVKVGIALDDSDLYASQWRYSALPFADPVLLTDYLWDTTAQRWDCIRWEGNIYEMPLADIKYDERNDPEVVAQCQPGQGLRRDGDDLEDALIGRSTYIPGTDSDLVQLIDIYLPRHRMIATFPKEGSRPLRVQNYLGPPSGPYHKLVFHPVPGRTRGIAPAEFAAPMADLMSLMFQDMGRQASRRKTLLLVSGDETEAQRINAAHDGQAIPVADPGACQERSYGGVDGSSVQFAQVLREWYSWCNGNLDVAGGLAAGAQTLGQEKMLQATSSARLNRMQYKVTEWTRQIMQAIAWYIWNDPECRIKTIDKVANTDIELQYEFPIVARGDDDETDVRAGTKFESFEFDIEPVSLTPQSPAAKLQMVRAIVQELIPLQPMFQQSGTAFDMTQYVKLVAELGDVPELLEIIRVQPPDPSATQGPEFDKPPKPAFTTRVYERARGGGPSPGGAARAAAMGMSGDDGED